MVAFHAQQAIEKAFMAVLEEFEGFVPKIHVLVTLCPRVIRRVQLSIEIDLLEELDKLYLDARYPGDLGLLPAGKPSRVDADRFADGANRMVLSVEKFLSAKK